MQSEQGSPSSLWQDGGEPGAPANAWLTAATLPAPAPSSLPTAVAADIEPHPRVEIPPTGPSAPHRALTAPPPEAALASRRQRAVARVWWLGAHGGAGESTLAALMEGSSEADHAWPEVVGEPAAVVLVARPSAHGLDRAQVAATQWASGATPDVRLLGLVLIADAPGRAPAPLRAWTKVLSGGVPRVWHLRWNEPLRLGADPSSQRPSLSMRRLLSDVDALTNSPPPPTTEEVSHVAHAAAHR